jgi:DNA-binding IclR family transcriptional regulator
VLDEDILRFLRGAISSLWALEQLLLLHRDAARGWTIDAMTRELRSSKPIVARIMAQFVKLGLVHETEGFFRYHPRTAELDALVSRLAADYARFPVAVTQAIVAAADREIQTFANAFRLDNKSDSKE